MPLAPATRLGPYEIVSPLGAGGMGEVYRARDTRLGRDVALKILPPAFAADPDRMARFQREAQLLASLNHPHIAALYGLEDSAGVSALVMELVDGPTLQDRIRQGPIPLDEALPVAREIAEALEAAHEKGIIHRDLKPANIKLTADGKVKVLDFGLAKALDSDVSLADPANSPTLTISATRAGMILGTAGYMAPEQAKAKTVDRRADIWAFGVVMMEMLTGRPVYTGETAPETLAAVIMKDPAFDHLPSGVPGSIRTLLRRCLDKDPRRRLRDIGEARIAIEDVLSGKLASESAPGAAPGPLPKRSLAPWIAAALCLLAAIALAVVNFRHPVPETHAVRFSVFPPPKTQFGPLIAAGPVTVSPDGLRLAVVAATAGGALQLWIHSFDSLAAQPLSGTDGVSYPFWSADSRFIAFFADGKLKKFAVSGGPPQTICAAPAGRGGSWAGGADGVIVFAPGNFTGLSRVSPAGGDPVPLTQLDKAAGEISHRQPHFLPDGRHFLYIAADYQIEKGNVWIAELPAASAAKPTLVRGKRLMPSYTHVSYAAPGYLLFVRDNNLLGQRFDADKLALAGEPFPIAEGVGVFGLRAVADFSVSDAGVLAYRNSFTSETTLAWFDRQGKGIDTIPTAAQIQSAAISPDGRMVAGTKITGAASGANLWLLDALRGTASRFTFETLAQGNPVWSPDGKRIAYAWQREASFDLYAKDASGVANPEALLKSGTDKRPTDWSRDGRWLIYTDQVVGGREAIWALPMRDGHPAPGEKPIQITTAGIRVFQAVLSPDAGFLAYVTGETGRPEVYVRTFNPGSPASGGKWQISSGGGTSPAWNRNGKELFFLALDNSLMAVPAVTGNSFQAGTPAPVIQMNVTGAGFARVYDVSPDGKRFLATVPVNDEKAPPVTVVLNWAAGLKR